jgi:hypothetical protein
MVLLRLKQRVPAQLDEAMRQRLLDEQFEQWLKMQIDEAMQDYHSQVEE